MARDNAPKRKDRRAWRPTTASWLVAGLVAAGLAHAAAAQSSETQPPKRPLDNFAGIVASCAPAPELKWTVDACAELLDDVQRQGKALGMPTAVRALGASVKDAGATAGFDGDKAIDLRLEFEVFGDKRNRVSLGLSSHFIWVPTEKDIRNVVPGQRIRRLFFLQSAETDDSTRRKGFMPFAKKVVDNFFRVGQGKPAVACSFANDVKDCPQ